MIKKLSLLSLVVFFSFNFAYADSKLLACLCPCFFNKKALAPRYTSQDYHDHVGKRYIRVSVSERDKKSDWCNFVKDCCCYLVRKKQA